MGEARIKTGGGLGAGMGAEARRFAWQHEASDAMSQAFAEDGYLIIDNFVAPATCDSLMARANSLIDAFDVEAHQVVFSATAQSHAADDYFRESAYNISCFLEEGAFDADGKLNRDKHVAVNKIGHAIHDLDPVFSAFSHADDLAAITHCVGMKTPLQLQSMVICKQPAIGGEVSSHQDSTFIYTEPESCIGFWFALEDATLENGCMYAAPGGHRAPLRNRFQNVDGAMKMNQLDDADLPEATVPLIAPKGTLVVLHGRLPHTSPPNLSAKSRYAYTIHMIEAAADYAADNWLQRPDHMPLKGF
jgi:phytanoyl-CoA hydroxylase